MRFKNFFPVIAMLLTGLFTACEKDQITDPSSEPVSQGDEYLLLKAAPAGSPVATHGQLYVSGRYMKDKNNSTMNLRGHSFGWSSWWPQYWNANVVNWLTTDFKVDIVRAAMGIDATPGYLTGDMTNQKNLVKTVVDASIAAGVYVIIDWHCEAFHQTEAVAFFREMAQTYGSQPNVIYEILNEPTTQTWAEVKSYSAAVIAAIRQYDPDNIIVVGCPQWDQLIRQVADSPLTGYTNIMYTVHFYAASHGQWLRDDCAYAISKNIPIFVTESSGMEASGSGAINYTEWEAWFSFMEANYISWLNWSVSDKADESCSILQPGAPSNGGWTSSQMKESGNYIRAKIRSFATTPPTTVNLPGTVEAENYTAMSGIQTESCSEGGLNVGWIDNGDWMDYSVNPSSSGSYTINLRVASTGTTGICQIKSGSTILATVNIPNTGGWQNWTTISTTVNLTAGIQTIRLQATGSGWNINWWSAATNTTTVTLPGTVQAENYSAMSGIQTEACSEGGLNVGWIESGDWMDYSVNPSSSGSYTINLRVASTGTTGICQIKSGSTVLATVNIPNTGGWQNWTTVSTTVNLTAGSQTIRLQATGSGWNINWWSAAVSTPTNKLLNPGFETTSNWTIESPFSRSTAVKRTGSYSLRLLGTTSWHNTYQTISVTPNTNYTFSAYIQGTARVYMAVYKVDWSGTVASSTKTPTSSWVKYTLTFNSGSNSQVIIDLQDAGNGTSYIDDTSVL